MKHLLFRHGIALVPPFDVLPRRPRSRDNDQKIAYANVCPLLAIELSRLDENESPLTAYITSMLGEIADNTGS